MTTLRLRLDLTYAGTGFAGWARQPGLRTVQGELEAALATVLRIEDGVRLTVAGRTDAGVHARGQVAHLDVEEASLAALRSRDGARGPQVLVRRLAGLLPEDLVVRSAVVAPEGFDARFAALRRSYAYRVRDDEVRPDPLTRAMVLWHRHPLDAEAMSQAAAPLVGLHDFAAFCRPRPGATTIRTLEVFDWHRVDEGADAGLLVARVQADAFCHSMVRSLVGACLAVGRGRRDPGWPAQLLADGKRLATVAPALGLTLERVDYPPDTELVRRAGQTRARRAAVVPEGCCD
ncbi:MAG: tRNA pseudouridine(38-40) synthase TruA [Cellulomonas sp.]|nr:tRNA pseudouridine(38-40) synthase TruA [Actinomycetota bacterium]MCG2798981.1 tRNA pseudouridine(38-40) synthase TruA [Cellulomonas sp.]